MGLSGAVGVIAIRSRQHRQDFEGVGRADSPEPERCVSLCVRYMTAGAAVTATAGRVDAERYRAALRKRKNERGRRADRRHGCVAVGP